jgi:hypothetical protein
MYREAALVSTCVRCGDRAPAREHDLSARGPVCRTCAGRDEILSAERAADRKRQRRIATYVVLVLAGTACGLLYYGASTWAGSDMGAVAQFFAFFAMIVVLMITALVLAVIHRG